MRLAITLCAILGLLAAYPALRAQDWSHDAGGAGKVGFTLFVVISVAGESQTGSTRFLLMAVAVAGLALGARGCPPVPAATGLLRGHPTGNPLAPARLYLTIVVWCLVVDVMSNASGTARLPADLASVVVAMLALRYARSGGLPLSLVAAAGLCAISAVLLYSLTLPVVEAECHDGKCNALGTLLTGPFPSENFIGLFAAMTGTFLLVSWTGRLRLAGAATCALLLYLTGSRSGLIVSAVALLAVVGARARGAPLPARPEVVRLRAAADPTFRLAGPLQGLAFGAAFVGLGLYLVSRSDPLAFTDRGIIWIRARSAMAGHSFWGVGESRWVDLQSIGLLPEHFAHSEYLALWFSAGLVALLLYALLLAAMVNRMSLAVMLTGSAWSAAGLLPLLGIAMYGLTEVVWNPLSVDGLTWCLFALVVGSSSAAASPPSGVPVGPAACRARHGGSVSSDRGA